MQQQQQQQQQQRMPQQQGTQQHFGVHLPATDQVGVQQSHQH
jgi:hypothetical protein